MAASRDRPDLLPEVGGRGHGRVRSRTPSGYRLLRHDRAAPAGWAAKVMTLEAAESTRSGAFSRSGQKGRPPERDVGGQRPQRPDVEEQQDEGERHEHGLRHQPQGEEASATRAYGPARLCRTYRTQASRVSSQKKVLSTSLRSEIQATDSTWSGWRAKRAATRALRQGDRSAGRRSRRGGPRSGRGGGRWRRGGGRRRPEEPDVQHVGEPGERGASWRASNVVKEPRKPLHVRPASTRAFS